ncbi:MAG: hypothetical protein MUC92_07380 [Fimbriimonadaceae bacterium]|nr:hypothetical protein [Fimbriimonadaceae bacterium]
MKHGSNSGLKLGLIVFGSCAAVFALANKGNLPVSIPDHSAFSAFLPLIMAVGILFAKRP